MVSRFGKKLVESGFTSVAKRRKNLAYPTKLDAKLDKLKTDISSKENQLKKLLEKELISKNKYQTLLDAYKKPRQKKIFKLQDQIAARAKEMERTGKVQTTRNNPRLAAEKERMNKDADKKRANRAYQEEMDEYVFGPGRLRAEAGRQLKKGGKLRGMGKALRGGGKVMRG
tara:strand:- start:61 stop:573 length:513 start_codon:yes stop_codon:yes gene_type:complete